MQRLGEDIGPLLALDVLNNRQTHADGSGKLLLRHWIADAQEPYALMKFGILAVSVEGL